VERLRRRIPDWLIGLLLAIVITAVLYILFGAGDDPTLGGG
jgi:type VI protein secretion system component VasF